MPIRCIACGGMDIDFPRGEPVCLDCERRVPSRRTRPDAATVRAIVEAVEKASYWEVAEARGDGCCSSRERRIDVDKLTNELKKLL